MTVSMSNGVSLGNLVTAATDAVTGDVAISGGGNSDLLAYTGLRPAQSRILKRFVDLANVTKTDSTISTVLSIDQNSPFGGPAMKVVATAGASGYVQFDLTNLNIPDFDGNVAAAQVYTALTGTATDVATLTPNATPTVTLAAAGTGLYLSLTTGQGSAATADIFVYGRPA